MIVLNDKIIEILKIVILVMLFTAALFPLVKWISHHVNALDYPNERKVHKKPMPLMGGLMMFFGFLFGYMLFAPKNDLMLSILKTDNSLSQKLKEYNLNYDTLREEIIDMQDILLKEKLSENISDEKIEELNNQIKNLEQQIVKIIE